MSYFSDVEHNRYNPSLDTTIALANALGVTL
ncbi:helix-turn-helix transcriptional regulator, partial [Clostridium perfringens]|nr:helix-turn-helix transcriptional regulator [Clostridium perfringens]